MNLQDAKTFWLSLPPRRRKRICWTAGALTAYTILGFLILPPIVRAVAVKRLSTLLDREVSIRKVRINPYVLSATIRGLLVKDKDGQPLISWDEAYANFQLVSFLGKPWVFKEVRLTRPFARLQVNRDRSLNVSDLLAKFSQATPNPGKPAKPLSLRVSRLHIIGASASFTDLTPSTPFHRMVGPVEVTLTGFHSDPNNRNPYAFSGTTDSGEKFSWSGYFSLNPISSEGEWRLEGLSLPKYAPLYQDLVRFDIREGIVDFRANYRFGLNVSNCVAAVSNATFFLTSLKVAGKNSTQDLLDLDKLAIGGVQADATKRTLAVGSVFVEGASLALKRDREGVVNAVELGRPAETATNAPGSILLLLQAATNAFATLLHSTNLGAFTLHNLDVTNCSVLWEDHANRRPVRLPVDRIGVSARELSNMPGSNMTASVSLRWNTNGTLHTEATARIAPVSADITLALHEINLDPLDPYLEPFLNVFVRRSKLGLDGRIMLTTDTNELPDVRFNGELRLDDFAAADSVMDQDLVQWKSLRFSGMNATLVPPQIEVKELALIEPRASVTIETNRLINVLTALNLAQTNSPPPKVASAPAPPAAGGGKAGLEKRFGGLIQEVLTSSTNASGSTIAPKIMIDTIVVSNALVQFNDRSLQPRVSLSIDELNGTITGLSSEELKRAKVHFEGRVDHSSPVVITGQINPLGRNASSDLTVAVRHVNLTPASPYVGKFAGYRLDRGELNLDLNYGISGRRLEATNLIVLDQFTLGDKVNSPEATKLPVRLAVAVLKDRSGRITLDVPVQGSLDDPQFRLHKVIVQAFVNILTRVVTSPFAALGAIVGGNGEELSFQDFAPGNAELQPAATQKLQILAKALYERPALMVEIEGSVDPVADRDALAQLKLEGEFRIEKWGSMRKSKQARVKPDEIEIQPEAFDDYVKRAYSKAFSQGGSGAPGNTNGPSGDLSPSGLGVQVRPATTRRGAEGLMQTGNSARRLSVEEMGRQLRRRVEVTDEDFRRLASQRADRVRQFLQQSGHVEPSRITIAKEPEEPLALKGSRTYIQLR